jgi:hypothetical protein
MTENKSKTKDTTTDTPVDESTETEHGPNPWDRTVRAFKGLPAGYRRNEDDLRNTAFEGALLMGGFAVAGPPGLAVTGGIVAAGRLADNRRKRIRREVTAETKTPVTN